MKNYEVYIRNEDGKRDTLVNGIVSITATFRFNEPVKFEIEGAGLEKCPFSYDADIAVFRNNEILFCGYITEIKDKYSAMTKIYDWTISGYSDIAKLNRRIVFADPTDSTPDPDSTYSDTGALSNILFGAIRKNAGSDALTERQFDHMGLITVPAVGETVTLDSKYDELLKFVQDNLKDTEYQIKEVWDMATGTWSIKIQSPEDVSDNVIFSVENGSVSEWERTVTIPKANWLLVTGCSAPIDENDESLGTATLSCIVMDTESISKWGRIEAIIQRSDINRIVKKDDNDEVTYEEPWSSVVDRLESAAHEELVKASAQYGYKLTTTEINRNVFLEDYDIGSLVSVRIGGDEFKAKVDEIKITYEKGIETIVPSVGTLQRGELQSVFTSLGTLKDQVKVLQKSEIIAKREVQEVKKVLKKWANTNKEEEDDPAPTTLPQVIEDVVQIRSMVNRLKSNVRDMFY